MAQKLGCNELCKLCINTMLKHYTALTAAGGWGFPHPCDVALAWKVTASDCTLRQFCVMSWAQPEAEGPMETYKAQLPGGFREEVMKAIGVEFVGVRVKGSLREVQEGFNLVVR